MTNKQIGNSLQDRYQKWHEIGMDLAFQFTTECKDLINQIYEIQWNCDSPDIACENRIPIDYDDTFTEVWVDHEGRPCCSAIIDDGAPMGWRVEFLDLHHKHQLHKLLLKLLAETKVANNNG